MSTIPLVVPFVTGVEQPTASSNADVRGRDTKRKVILRDGVAFDVIEREIDVREVNELSGDQLRRAAESAYQSMSSAAKAVLSIDSVGRDDVAERAFSLSGAGSTAGAPDELDALARTHTFFQYEVAGEIAPQPGAATRQRPPYPMRIIQHPQQRPALRIMKEGATGKDGQSTFVTLFSTSDFFIERVTEPMREKMQLFDTFAGSVAYFFGKQPEVFTFVGVMYNTANLNWLNGFIQDYEREIRATKSALMRARAYMSYDNQVLEGFVIGLDVDRSSDIPTAGRFVLSFLVVGRTFLNAIPETGERTPDKGSVDYMEGVAAGQGQALRAYGGGEDAFSTADGRDRIVNMDPMKVTSLEELNSLESTTVVPPNNSSQFLACERFLLTAPAPVPIVGFVASPKDEAQSGPLSVTFSDPLSRPDGLDPELRQRVAERPEGLLTVPPSGSVGESSATRKLWEAGRITPIDRVVVLDTRKFATDQQMLESYKSGNGSAPHYFVCRGDGVHPITGARLVEGQVVQMIQEAYTAYLLEPHASQKQVGSVSVNCDEAFNLLLSSGEVVQATEFGNSARERFTSFFDITGGRGLGITGLSADWITTTPSASTHELFNGRKIVAVASTISDLISGQPGRIGDAGYGRKFAENALALHPLEVGGERLSVETLMSVMAGLLYQESTYKYDGADSVGPYTPSAGSAAGIAQFMEFVAAGDFGARIDGPKWPRQGDSEQINSVRTTSKFQVVAPNKGRFMAGVCGNVLRDVEGLNQRFKWRVLKPGAVNSSRFGDHRFSVPVSVGGVTQVTFFDDEDRYWYDDRFDPFRSIAWAYQHLLRGARVIKLGIGTRRSAGKKAPQVASLVDALLFSIAAYNSGAGGVNDARVAARNADPSAGATFCSIARDPTDTRFLPKETVDYVYKIARSIADKRQARGDDTAGPTPPVGSPSAPSPPDAGTIYVCINGPVTHPRPYSKKQVDSAIRLVNDIVRRNPGIKSGRKLMGRSHVGGTVAEGDSTTSRFKDPVTVSAVDEQNRDSAFDFAYSNSDTGLSLDSSLVNAELNGQGKTQIGNRGAWRSGYSVDP